jgi:hypothetical protein
MEKMDEDIAVSKHNLTSKKRGTLVKSSIRAEKRLCHLKIQHSSEEEVPVSTLEKGTRENEIFVPTEEITTLVYTHGRTALTKHTSSNNKHQLVDNLIHRTRSSCI